MILPSIILGLVAFLALLFLYKKSPKPLQSWFVRWPWTTELLSLLFFFFTITSVTQSLIGVFGSLFAGLFWSIWFWMFEHEQQSNLQ